MRARLAAASALARCAAPPAARGQGGGAATPQLQQLYAEAPMPRKPPEMRPRLKNIARCRAGGL